MKSGSYFARIIFVAVAGMLLAGCLTKTAIVPQRHFVLAAIPANDPARALTEHESVGIGFVKMPSYLLGNSMAIRNGANEIEYVEDALWAERLDQCFQQTLAANLSRLLPADSIYLTDWGREQVKVRVFINVQQFDVDTGGRGTLVAQWRIVAPDSDTPLKNGRARFDRTGAPPRGKPEVIAGTLSDLAADFSRELAPAIRESAERLTRAD